VQRVQAELQPWLQEAATAGGTLQMPGRGVAKAVGFLQCLRQAVPLVAAFTRALTRWLGELHALMMWDRAVTFDEPIQLTPEALAEAVFWVRALPAWKGGLVRPATVSRVLYTDASGTGYGALLHRVLQRREEPALLQLQAQWEPNTVTAESVITELRAAWRGLLAAGGEVAGQRVLLRTDNVSTYWAVANGGWAVTQLARLIQVYYVVCIHAAKYCAGRTVCGGGRDHQVWGGHAVQGGRHATGTHCRNHLVPIQSAVQHRHQMKRQAGRSCSDRHHAL
jgi:hypothetical protein